MEPTTSQQWRIQTQDRGGSPYVTLIRGTTKDRVSISLGHVSEEDAAYALDVIRREDARTLGTPRHDRILRVVREHEPNRRVEVARKFLLDRASDMVDEVLGHEDHGAMRVSEYHARVYWPQREVSASKATVRAETGFWRQILASNVGSTRLRDLDAWLWESYVEALQARGPSARTAALHKATYKAMLEFAHRKGHVKEVHKFFVIKGSTKRTRKQEEPLTLEEVARLLAVADPMRRCMWAVGVGQGLRPGELTRCRVEDFDLDAAVMDVRGTKTEASADVVPLTPLTVREVRRYLAHLGNPTSGLLFSYRGSQIEDYGCSLATDVEEAKIDKHVTPYLLRASFATIAWCLGIPKDVARRILRHTSEAMIDRVYCRPRPRDLAKHLKAFELVDQAA